MPPHAIGIDLGTTYSCVGVFQNGKVEIIPNDQGNRITPSIVAFTDQDRLIGEAAKNQAGQNPLNTIFDAKRLIGRKHDDPTVERDSKVWPFEIVNRDGKPKIFCQYKNEAKTFDAEEISAMVLTKMKETAEKFLGEDVTRAVITVPAYFNDSQRQATKDAGEIAGLKVERVINEPTAAGIAYGFDKEIKGKKTILVFDLGGGTFDVSILTVEGGDIQVKSTAGDTHLGGEDFDDLLVDHFKEEISRKKRKDISANPKHKRRLRTACERAKRTLSSAMEADVELDAIDFNSKITRAKFEELAHNLFLGTIETVDKALTDANLSKEEVDEVILVGGSTRIPKIQSMVQDFFDGKTLNKTVHPDEAVAFGAAVLAANLQGVEDNKVQELKLTDVAPLSLGVDIKGDIMSVIVPRNTPLPTTKTRPYTTIRDDQTSVTWTVFEGERAMTTDNHELGKFTLDGIPKAEAGVPTMDVTFKVDENGILHATAVEKSLGTTSEITITNEKGRLSQEEIDRMVDMAERLAVDDEKARERVRARNALDDSIADGKRKAKARGYGDYSSRVEAKATEIQRWLENNQSASKEDMQQKRREFEKVVNTN